MRTKNNVFCLHHTQYSRHTEAARQFAVCYSDQLSGPTAKLLPLHFARPDACRHQLQLCACLDGTETSHDADFGQSFCVLLRCNICVLLFPTFLPYLRQYFVVYICLCTVRLAFDSINLCF